MDRNFWRSGHTPTLFCSFLYFDLSFMVWYLLGPMQVQIAQSLGLSTQERGLMVATPILAGAILRVFMGLLADRVGTKRAGLLGQLLVIAALIAQRKNPTLPEIEAAMADNLCRCGTYQRIVQAVRRASEIAQA